MRSLLLSPILLILAYMASAQCGKHCSGSGCANDKKAETTMSNESSKRPMSCKLTSPELRKRKEEVIGRLRTQVVERKEQHNGYSYRFRDSDGLLDELTAFIKSERQCCDFFNFRLSVMNDNSVWLEITGEEGVKEFITAELEL